ncbi:helix-turn-helix domain-containing protein [Isoptericola variabilis]|uniref:Putative phytochrome sensor protein n=1 Tax=Isoptericola variabilis (strain 225) TaxID=743718 RepID=F6FPC8_ISOV2|nr:helix-turn-helix domain-containing protein [Isoptericola variabilis]AEG43641.1 putative phytochrome sensor protein [Isoptericola variabilis 225]TWH31989.1 GAF domain-containing protein [Isoptericola variabilis J7]
MGHPRTTSTVRDARRLRAAHETFLSTGTLPPGIDPVVAESWHRSLTSGVDPDEPRTVVGLDGEDLETYRASHPLAAAMPVVRELLVEAATDEGLVVAVSDDVGRLLWVEGNLRVRSAVDRVGFVEGALWSEDRVGTNAPGTALATRRAVRVVGAEHFSRPVQELSCAAAPVRDLRTGGVLGVLDVTGGQAAGSQMVLSLVRAVAGSAERELARTGAPWSAADARGPAVDLEVLGSPRWLPDGGRALSLRHAEILLLLAEHPEGLSADALAVLLHPGDLSDVTVRAEVSRLRRVVGPVLAGSRPYRLARPLRTDAGAVRAALAAGDVAGALAAYRAPLLPRSVAPGVERLRAELSAEVRCAVLASHDVDVLDAWTRHPDAADDLEAWTALLRRAEPGSPRAARARAHVTVLDTALR